MAVPGVPWKESTFQESCNCSRDAVELEFLAQQFNHLIRVKAVQVVRLLKLLYSDREAMNQVAGSYRIGLYNACSGTFPFVVPI